MPRTRVPNPITALLTLPSLLVPLLFATPAAAVPEDLDFFTSFEEFNPNSGVGEIIVVGLSPTTAEFGGDAFAGRIGAGALYHTGVRSWMVLANGMVLENGIGVIKFVTTDAGKVEFWVRVLLAATGDTVITAFDAFDVIADGPKMISPSTEWQLVLLAGSIARIDVVNLDANEMSAIDDFGFTPLPEPGATLTLVSGVALLGAIGRRRYVH
jgi:hypothetical protein